MRNPSGGSVEETHTEAGGEGTFVVNASENDGRGFGIHCCHDHCLRDRSDGTKVDRLIFVRRMLKHGWLTLGELESPDFGGGPLSNRIQSIQPQSHDLRVADRDGKGIDVGVFHANMIASGQCDLQRLNELCGTQIAKDVTAKHIAEFIESGRVTVADLIECSGTGDAAGVSDPYIAKLAEIARQKSAGNLFDHQVDRALAAVREKHTVKQKTIESDFKRVEREAQSPSTQAKLGLLSVQDTLR